MTDAEAADMESQAARTFEQQAADRADSAAAPRAGAAVGSYNQAVWADPDRKVVATRQTSLVVDPPDGRVPVRPEAEQQRDAMTARATDSYEFLNVWDRCITRGVPGGFFPAGYNNAYQIVQTPGYVIIVSEMIHEARIIPTDGRPHRPGGLRTMTGDSVGRWEGDTLVVDTANYNDKGSIATASTSGRMRGVPQSEALHVVERFRRVDAGDNHLHGHRRRSERLHAAVDGIDAARPRRQLSDLRVRLPRSELRRRQHPSRRTAGREEMNMARISSRRNFVKHASLLVAGAHLSPWLKLVSGAQLENAIAETSAGKDSWGRRRRHQGVQGHSVRRADERQESIHAAGKTRRRGPASVTRWRSVRRRRKPATTPARPPPAHPRSRAKIASC